MLCVCQWTQFGLEDSSIWLAFQPYLVLVFLVVALWMQVKVKGSVARFEGIRCIPALELNSASSACCRSFYTNCFHSDARLQSAPCTQLFYRYRLSPFKNSSDTFSTVNVIRCGFLQRFTFSTLALQEVMPLPLCRHTTSFGHFLGL